MIEVRNLSKSFEDQKALNGLSLRVNTGSIYGLVGTNGSGKTTLLKHITGVLKQDSGEVLFDGVPVYENCDIKKGIGFLPDDLSYLAQYDLKRAGSYYSSVYRESWDRERFDSLLAEFDLREAASKRMSGFSKGMQKQAAFALIMASKPDYLILDEPIDGLDPIVRRLVWKYIVDDVSERNMTVLVSSHNLREMEGICDHIGILHKGEMKLERDLDDLKSDIHKVQAAFGDRDEEIEFEGLNILHREKMGNVELLIVRNDEETVKREIEGKNPLIFDMLPLSLEEIFIYELGGDEDAKNRISDIVL